MKQCGRVDVTNIEKVIRNSTQTTTMKRRFQPLEFPAHGRGNVEIYLQVENISLTLEPLLIDEFRKFSEVIANLLSDVEQEVS